MSYILEALKKAQAERQLGTSPTLHAPTLHGAEQTDVGGRLKKPLVLAMLAMAAVIAVLLVIVLRPARQVAQPAQLATMPAASPATVMAGPPPAAIAASTATATPLPAPVAALPPPVATLSPAALAPASASVPPVVAVANAAKPGAAPEEPIVNQRDLPEPIQRSIPQIAVGGYIYSKNPADRLLLIDKVLRHEGEEVAPGLLLEKLQPKEAVFSFKGYRYRVPY